MKTWIFPNNPTDYDPQLDFDIYGKSDWSKNRKVETGDIVYIYRTSPIKQILWKCKVGIIDYYIRDDYDYDGTYSYTETEDYCCGPCCELIPLVGFDFMEELSFHSLREHGLKFSILGGQTINDELRQYLLEIEKNLSDSTGNEVYLSALSVDELRERAQKQTKKDVPVSYQFTKQYARNASVSLYAKMRANGICQLCGNPAPFQDHHGNPYLETHHIVWLSRGGSDTIDNVAALCPNCHRKMHILDSPSDIEKLLHAINEADPT